MDTGNPATIKRGPHRLSAALSSAFSEWILIILLLIDAFCLYLATKICHSCKLQTPCLLCSKFCYLLGNEKLGFYRNLVCDSHKLEISSLAFCHVHQKLGNADELCETCLLSFSKKISCLETCKFFLSKLGMDFDEGDRILNTSSGEELKVPLLKKDDEVGSPHAGKPCSCCSQPSRSTPYPFQIFENKTAFKEFALPESPLSEAKEIFPVPMIDDKSPGDHSFFKYRELKITSESESEFPLSDDEDRSKNAPRKSSAISGSSATDLRNPLHEDDSSFDPDHVRNEKPNPPISSEFIAEPVPTGIPNEFSGVDASRTSIVEDSDLLIDITCKAEMVTINSDHNLSSDIALLLESTRLHEDLKQRLSQIPSPRYLHYPWTDKNSQRSRTDDECKLFHSSSFHGLPSFNRATNVADGNSVRGVEGEVAVDRKSLSILYKELEEERNASAIAANQAMAMITKLQEEKAAMQLEVMQYCRLMEEQTDHDQDAIRNLNDQLTEREKEIQDLEAELESCRKLCGDVLLVEKVLEQSFDSDESEYSTTSTPHFSRSSMGRKKHHRAKENLLGFEEERQCASECLKKERNVCRFSNAGDSQHDGDDELDDECFGHDDDVRRVRFQQGLTEVGRTGGVISTDKHESLNFECMYLDENCSSPSVEPQSPIGEHEEHNVINSSCGSNNNLKTAKRTLGAD